MEDLIILAFFAVAAYAIFRKRRGSERAGSSTTTASATDKSQLAEAMTDLPISQMSMVGAAAALHGAGRGALHGDGGTSGGGGWSGGGDSGGGGD